MFLGNMCPRAEPGIFSGSFAINWGLVAGKTNTMWGWQSWSQPGTPEPKFWHHDILRKDGTPFDKDEVDFIQSLTKG